MAGTTGQINYFNTLIGRQINNSYQINSLLAVGGMGAVFQGTRLSNNEVVAIKIISPHLTANPVFVKRFQREAKVGVLLAHPHIVKVYEYGETDMGLLFMAMEYIEGKSLEDYMQRFGPLTVTRCLEILRPLCDALDTAHKRNILHRDLKPANILISKDKNEKECIKLVDFGLVKLLQPDAEITKGSNLTGLGEACGTPYYMSPEQVVGQPLGPSADIYSVGILLYQMLTGKLPFESGNIRQILALKINQDIPAPSEKFPFVPSVLDKVLKKALARNAGDRYQTARELFLDFQAATSQITLEFSQPTHPVIETQGISEIPAVSLPGTTKPKAVAEVVASTSMPLDNIAINRQIKILWSTVAVLFLLLIIVLALLLFR